MRNNGPTAGLTLARQRDSDDGSGSSPAYGNSRLTNVPPPRLGHDFVMTHVQHAGADGAPSPEGWACDDALRPDIRAVIVDPFSNDRPNDTTHARSIERGVALLTGTGDPRPPGARQPQARQSNGGRRILYLRAGVHALDKPLVLTAAADGLAIVACPGETAVLEGQPDAPTLILREVRGMALVGLVFAGPSPAQVSLDGARDCLIERDTFLRGGTALLLDHSAGNVIRRNLILHVAATGIELRDGSDGNTVADNVVDGADAPETHGGGVFLHGVSGNRIAHNLIRDTAGFGIGVSNWDAATVNVANVVEYNVLQDTARTAEDSGAIYVLGRSGADTGIVIAGNVVDGVGAGPGGVRGGVPGGVRAENVGAGDGGSGAGRHSVGIYLDDSTNGALVTRNLVRRVGSDAVQIHGGSDNRVENNLIDLGAGRPAAVLFQAAPADTNPLNAQTGNAVLRNVIVSSNADPKVFVWFDGGSPRIAGNLYANATGPMPLPDAPVADPEPVLADPSVVPDGAGTLGAGALGADARGRYAAVQAAAQAAIGFRPIDPASAGPRAGSR